MADARVAFISRYPVKGLSPQPLGAAQLTAGAHFPGDRLFAVENGPSGFVPGEPEHQPKIKFIVLMRYPALARLKTDYDDASGVLTIRRDGTVLAAGDLASPAGQHAIEQALEGAFAGELRGPARVLAAPAGFRFMDSRSGFVSLLNLASLRALAAKAGVGAIEHERFRANIMLDGLPPWGEFDLVGRTIRIGKATLEVLKPIERCAATHANPVTGVRDLDVIGTLRRAYDHHDCGVYARVVESGDVRLGDALAPPA